MWFRAIKRKELLEVLWQNIDVQSVDIFMMSL